MRLVLWWAGITVLCWFGAHWIHAARQADINRALPPGSVLVARHGSYIEYRTRDGRLWLAAHHPNTDWPIRVIGEIRE